MQNIKAMISYLNIYLYIGMSETSTNKDTIRNLELLVNPTRTRDQ